MIAGSLELQLFADVARLRADMDKAKSIVGAATDAMKRAADEVKTALGGMVTGISVAGVAAFVKNTIDAAATLHDLSVQAGMTVESLSGLAAVGKATATGADTITSSSNKLSKALATSNEESKGAATALKALGLNFDAFQKLSPDQRLTQIALAMSVFNDGSQKTAASMLLFGKAGAEMLPFLKDLASTGALNAKISTDQAEAAHNYEVALGRLKSQSDQWKRQLALELLPTLEAITSELVNITKVSNSAEANHSVLGDGIKTFFETVSVLGVNTVYVLKQTATEFGGIGAQVAAFLTGNWGRMAEIRKEMLADAAEARRQADQSSYNLLGITNSKAGAGQSAMNSATDPRSLGVVGDFRKNLTGLEGDATGGDKAYESLIKHIKEHLAAQEQELALGRQLTEQEKFDVKVRTDLAELLAKFPGLSKGVVDGLLAQSDARARDLAVQKSDQQSATNYAKDWAKTEEELAAADKARADERDRVYKAIADQGRSLVNSNALLAEEGRLMGATDKEREIALGYLKIEQETKLAIDKINQDLLLGEQERKKAIADTTANAELQKQGVIMQAQLNEQNRIWNSIDQTAHDVFVNIYDNGANAFKKLRDTLKATLLDLLYQMTVRKWILNIIAQVSGTQTGGGGGNILNTVGSVLNGGGGVGNLYSVGSQYLGGSMSGANAAGTLYGNASTTGSYTALDGLLATNGAYGTAAGAGAVGGSYASSVGAGFATDAMGATVAEGAAGATLAEGAGVAGGAAAGAGTAVAAAIPVVGWVIAIAGLLYSIFGNKGGGPKSEGYYNPYNSDQYYSSNHADVSSAARTGAQGMQAQYDSLVSAYGGTGGVQFGLGFSTDPKGKAPSQAQVGAGLNGQTLFNIADTNIGRSQDELTAAIAKLGSEAVLRGLQQSNLQGIIGDYLKALGDIAIKSADQVTAALARIQKAAQEKAALDERWFQLTSTEDEKTARSREQELAALDISNQAMAVRTFALQDEIAAQQKAQAVYADVAGEIDNMRKSIGLFLDKLGATSAGLASPEEQLGSAKAQFSRQLDLAGAGNRDAMQSITDYADQLLQAQIKYSASGPDTQTTIEQIKQALEALPGQLNPEEYVGKAVMDGASLLNATMQQLIAKADANSAAQIAAITQKAADQNAAVAAQSAAASVAADAAAKSQLYGTTIGSVKYGGGGIYPSEAYAYGTYNRWLTPDEIKTYYDHLYAQQASNPQPDNPGLDWFGGFAADGGVFTNSVVNGITPFLSNTGQLHVAGEAGPEAVMPLVNIGGSLGVRALQSQDDSRLAEVMSAQTDRILEALQSIMAVIAAGARGTIEAIGRVEENTKASVRAVKLQEAKATL